jgi:hypothetical protein
VAVFVPPAKVTVLSPPTAVYARSFGVPSRVGRSGRFSASHSSGPDTYFDGAPVRESEQVAGAAS